MGHRQFGNINKRVFRRIQWGLSPFEQKALPPQFIKNGLVNVIRRFSSKFLIVFPPIAFTFYWMDWAKKENLRQSRKNPAVFVDEH